MSHSPLITPHSHTPSLFPFTPPPLPPRPQEVQDAARLITPPQTTTTTASSSPSSSPTSTPPPVWVPRLVAALHRALPGLEAWAEHNKNLGAFGAGAEEGDEGVASRWEWWSVVWWGWGGVLAGVRVGGLWVWKLGWHGGAHYKRAHTLTICPTARPPTNSQVPHSPLPHRRRARAHLPAAGD